MSIMKKEIQRVKNCDKIRVKCTECGKDIELEFDYRSIKEKKVLLST
ncbi:hypothetical protein [Sporomusa sp.]|nr:hypothetical protein [Sporomusa sp.]HWR42552.1 hypothetical protein [Sporomusa sp.]